MAMLHDHAQSCKRHRMDIMDEYLASIGYRRKPIPKDGSCLFRAFSEQLFKTQAHHLQIREACIYYMKHHQSLFENFIDDPFDEYLHRMMNPKESADQMEISALSKMYMCDFHIYHQPGQVAKNVTDNDFSTVILLCHSGQKHYDTVFPSSYFKSSGICQSILYSILFKNVFGMSEEEEQKCVNTLRMLSSNNSDEVEEDEHLHFTDSSVYQPSIGILTPDIPPEKQFGMAYKFPVSLDFVRSLEPSVFRNIDYDFWITIKRKQQYIDFAVGEGMQYLIGDRCLVILSIYSKPLVSHVQEVCPDNGPITVFIEALGGMHTTAVKNAKPLDSFGGSCRSEQWTGKWRRRPFSEGSWDQFRNGTSRKSFKSRELESQSGDFSHNQKYFDVASSAQQKRGKGNLTGGFQDRIRYSSKPDLSLCRNVDDFSPTKSRRFSKSKARWNGMSRKYSSTEHLASTSRPSVLLPDNSFCDDTWADAHDYSEAPDSTDSAEGSNTVYLDPNAHSTPPQKPDEDVVCPSSSPTFQTVQSMVDEMGNLRMGGYQFEQTQLQQDAACGHVDRTQPMHGQPTDVPVARPQAGFPYSGTLTMLDADGRELFVSDNKNPFQYFYDLGVEYYRQLSGSVPKPAPVAVGNPSPGQSFPGPIAHGPIMQPQPIGFVRPNAAHFYTAPHVHQVSGGGMTVVPHFHAAMASTNGIQSPYQSGQLMVHVPPPQQQQPQCATSAIPSTAVQDDVSPPCEAQSADITAHLVTHPLDVAVHRPPVPVAVAPTLSTPSVVLPSCPMGTAAFQSCGFAPPYPGYHGALSYGPGLPMYDPGAPALYPPSQAQLNLPPGNQFSQ